jgi:hypothetical protein
MKRHPWLAAFFVFGANDVHADRRTAEFICCAVARKGCDLRANVIAVLP